jgi:hypothetical protein
MTRHSTWLPWQRGALFCVGFAPIGALSMALLGLLPLHLGAALLVFPAAIAGLWLGWRERTWGRLALAGFAAGILATGAYDVLRLGLVWMGLWDDFIPQIGRMVLLDDDAHPVWGYLWRFLGNGGGMGLAFAVLPWRGPVAGAIYGTLICGCLFLTILLSPDAAQRLFTLSAATMAAALAGHWIYGAVLGGLTSSWLQRPPGATGSDFGIGRLAGLGAARIQGDNAP